MRIERRDEMKSQCGGGMEWAMSQENAAKKQLEGMRCADGAASGLGASGYQPSVRATNETSDPVAWMDIERGICMPTIIFKAWRKVDPDKAKRFVPLYTRP